jgi:hypothetical protein
LNPHASASASLPSIKEEEEEEEAIEFTRKKREWASSPSARPPGRKVQIINQTRIYGSVQLYFPSQFIIRRWWGWGEEVKVVFLDYDAHFSRPSGYSHDFSLFLHTTKI